MMNKSRRMRWVGLVVCMSRREMRTKYWLESLNGRNHSEDLGVDGRTVLK
jgi:hypothetical protein